MKTLCIAQLNLFMSQILIFHIPFNRISINYVITNLRRFAAFGIRMKNEKRKGKTERKFINSRQVIKRSGTN